MGGDVAGCCELIENGRNEGIGEAAGSCKKLGICVRVCDCVRVYVCVYVGVCVFYFVFVVFSCLEASTMLQSPEFLAIAAASFRSLFLAILAE